jgi:hypothetical protein
VSFRGYIFKDENVLWLTIEGMQMKTDVIETNEMNRNFTDLVTRDQLIDRLNAYLSNEPLNIGKGEYCYVKIVRNHLEIGRAKIILEE